MKILFFFFWGVSFQLAGQPLPVDAVSGKIYFTEEVLAKDGPQADLYYRAKDWFATSNNNSRNLKTDDFANGVLIGNSQNFISFKDENKNKMYILSYQVKVEVEDDRFWYSLFNFYLQPSGQGNNLNPGKGTPAPIPLETFIIPKKAAPDRYKIFLNSLEFAINKSIADTVLELKSQML